MSDLSIERSWQRTSPDLRSGEFSDAHTLRIHLSAILRVLGVTNRTQAAVVAVNHYNEQQRNEAAHMRA